MCGLWESGKKQLLVSDPESTSCDKSLRHMLKFSFQNFGVRSCRNDSDRREVPLASTSFFNTRPFYRVKEMNMCH